MGAATEDHHVVRLIPPAGVTHPVLLRLNDAAAEHARAPTMAAVPRSLPASSGVRSQRVRSEPGPAGGTCLWGPAHARPVSGSSGLCPVALCGDHGGHVPGDVLGPQPELLDQL